MYVPCVNGRATVLKTAAAKVSEPGAPSKTFCLPVDTPVHWGRNGPELEDASHASDSRYPVVRKKGSADPKNWVTATGVRSRI